MKKTNKSWRQVSQEIISEISDKFVACLEQGKVPWHQPWCSSHSGFIGSSGKSYSFMNSLLIALGGGSQGEYVTLNEAMARTGKTKEQIWDCFIRDADGKIPKSHMVVYYGNGEYTKKGEDGKPLLDEDGEEVKGHYRIIKTSHVWEVGKQIDVPKKFAKKVEEKHNNPIAEAEKIVVDYQAREGIKITNNSSEAFYSPSGDYISVPEINQFDGSVEYYGTLFHEIAHSTGHSKRLNRELTAHCMDRKSYSFEELVAEISSCTLLHDNGFATDNTDKNSVAYIQSWAKVLKSDPTMVEKACRLATKAVGYIYNGKE
jgi:antirestriction protein ArdC